MVELKGKGLTKGIALGKLRLCDVGQDNENIILWFGKLTSEKVLSLNKSKISALLCEENTEHSHAVIIAKAMGIPVIVGIHKPDNSLDGCEAAIDGEAGSIIICPDENTRAEMLKKLTEMQRYNDFLQNLKGKPSITSYGCKVQVLSSLGSFGELHSVTENDAEGIGLLRSELMFFEESEPPTEELQFQAYKRAAEKMQGKKVVVRIFDFSKDKRPLYLKYCKNAERGVQFCIENPDLLKTQLRAIVRASAFGDVRILLPMVENAEQIAKVQEIINHIKAELLQKGIVFNEKIKIGAMLETITAIENSSVLAELSDFFSIGTNDLSRAGFDEKSILNLIGEALKNAHKSGIPLCICGEMAGNLDFTQRLIDIGVDSFCVSPSEILPLRGKIRSI